MADRIQQRRDTAARWAQYNPILLEGEVGYVLDNPNQYKIGDGVHAWNELPLRGFDGTLVHELGDSETSAMSQKGVTYIVASGSDTSEMEVKRAITGGNVVGVPFLIKKGLMYTVSIESDGTTEGQVYAKPHNEGGRDYGEIKNTGTLSFIAVDDYDSVNVYFPAGSTGNVTVKVRIGNKERFENIENGLSENGFLDNAKSILSTSDRVERELSASSIDMEADFLNKGNLVTIGFETPSTSNVAVFVYDGTNHIQVTTFNKSGRITIRCYADFQYIRFYNNSTQQFSCYIEKATEYSETEYMAYELSWYFHNRNSYVMDITWKNAGKYWNENGSQTTQSNYDISEPIDVTGFLYYGFVGKLNAGNYTIVSVDEDGNFAGEILQKGVIEYQINGISLYIFKIPSSVSYISLSSLNSDKLFTKLFKLKSPFLMRMLDTMDVVEDNLGSSSSSSSTSGIVIEFHTPIASGQSFTVEINKTTHWDGKSVAIFGYKNGTEYDNLGSFFKNSQRQTFTAQNDYTFIKLYDNNDEVSGYSATLKIYNKVEQIENKVEQIENGLSENGFLDNAKSILSTSDRVERELSASSIDMEADFLNKGNLVTIGFETPSTSNVAVFVYDGTNHIQVTTFNKSGRITIRCYADFQYIRFYNNSTQQFSCYIEKATEYSETEYMAYELSWYFQNRNSEIMDITWKNAGMYWSESGNKITDSAYDISEPIDVSGFLYYGFVGKLNAGNYAIVSVDEEGNFAGEVLQKGVIEYQINGISLYIFKIPISISYISLSSSNSDRLFTKLFKLKSPFLMRMLDTMDVVEDNLGSSSSSSSNSSSSTSGRVIEFHTPIASGQPFTVEINKTTHWDGKSVAIFGYKNGTEYDNLGSFFKNSQRQTFTAQNDYTFIKLYDNNDEVSGYSATLKIENIVEQISPVIDYFKSSNPIVKELVWKDAGGFWNKSGEITTNAGYDYSEPVDVSDFKYFGLYGKLHKNNYTVVAVTEDNEFDRYVLQKGILEWQNTGNSLYIFKVPSDVNYISVSVENKDKSTVELFELKSPFLIDILDKMGKSNEYLFGSDSLQRSSTGTADRTVVVPYPIKKDKWYEVRLTTTSNSYVGDVYTTPYPTPAYGNVNKANPVLKLKAIADETAIRCFIRINGDGTSQSVTVTVRELGLQETLKTSENDRQYKVLILGDSYSQNNGPWVRGMQEWLNITSLVNLGVSSCSVKDKYQDRNTYPYTSRPVQANSTGNLNTLGCQIEKLKRLMAGTDLDSGENKIYETEDEYPNVIIIEGGMNDSFDSDEKEKTYYAQFEKEVSGVYIQQSSSKEATQGTCYIQTPIDEVDRTCYAGAYRYVVESLLTLFPKAQIFITTCSGLGYWNGSVVEKRYRTAVQQRKCANLCAATVIDWSAEGQISSILTHPQGSGTHKDPYIWGQCTLPNADSGDLMHPNTKGGKKYGHLAALVIKQRFLDIENM